MAPVVVGLAQGRSGVVARGWRHVVRQFVFEVGGEFVVWRPIGRVSRIRFEERIEPPVLVAGKKLDDNIDTIALGAHHSDDDNGLVRGAQTVLSGGVGGVGPIAVAGGRTRGACGPAVPDE
jgi:hypothetical protein